MPMTQSPIDVDDALERAGGDREFLKELMEIFLEDVPERLGEIKVAVASRDGEAMARAAHSVKGAAANLSANAVREAAFHIEQAGRDGDLTNADEHVQTLETKVRELADFASSL